MARRAAGGHWIMKTPRSEPDVLPLSLKNLLRRTPFVRSKMAEMQGLRDRVRSQEQEIARLTEEQQAHVEDVRRDIGKRVQNLEKESADTACAVRNVEGLLDGIQSTLTNLLSVQHDQADQISSRIGAQSDALSRQLERRSTRDFRQIQNLLALFAQLRPPRGLPPLGVDWTISPDLALRVVNDIRSSHPNLILECGSGVSSIVIGHALRLFGYGQLISLEHDSRFYAQTRDWIANHDLEDYVCVRLAPLCYDSSMQSSQLWYTRNAWEDLDSIDMVLVDGPPRDTGPLARYPALPLLYHHLSEGALIYLDDGDRDEERDVAQGWCDEGLATRVEDVGRYEKDPLFLKVNSPPD